MTVDEITALKDEGLLNNPSVYPDVVWEDLYNFNNNFLDDHFKNWGFGWFKIGKSENIDIFKESYKYIYDTKPEGINIFIFYDKINNVIGFKAEQI